MIKGRKCGNMTREEAIKLLRKLRETIDRNNAYGEAEEMGIQALEQTKTGYWKERRSRATGHIESVCSECGAEEGYPYNDYCGNCGARMVEQQESEDKE